MFSTPLFDELSRDDSAVLLLGCGGGYDIFCGIPLFLELRKVRPNKPVVFANLSFAYDLHLKLREGKKLFGRHATVCVEALASDFPDDAFCGDTYPDNYYPEYHLSRYLKKKHDIEAPCFALNLRAKQGLPKLSVANYAAALKDLVAHFGVKTIVLVDAGVDSVLKGDEEGLGTFEEDLLSIVACKQVEGVRRAILCVGLGTEARIGEQDFLQNWSSLTQMGGFLACVGWTPQIPSVQCYLDAVWSSVPTNTTINSVIAASVEGKYGQYCPPCLRARGLRDGDMRLQPLTSLCWFFDFEKVWEYRLYLNGLEKAESIEELEAIFHDNRRKAGVEDTKGRYLGNRKYSDNNKK